MNLLGFDTSSPNLSLAIMKKGKLTYEFNRKIRFGASKLIIYIDKALKKTRLKLKDFDAFVIGAGPGSFTGLRISHSIIKALSYSTNRPIITIGSFFACAYQLCQSKEKIAVVADARRNLIYFSSFKCKNNKLQRQTKEKLIALEELGNKSELFVTYDQHLRTQIVKDNKRINFYPKDIYPKARYLLELAKEKYKRSDFVRVDRLEPLYIHPKTCQIRKKK